MDVPGNSKEGTDRAIDLFKGPQVSDKVRHQMFKGRTFERIEKDLLRSYCKGKIKNRIMQALGAGG